MSALGQKQTFAEHQRFGSTGFLEGELRFGSKADICSAKGHVALPSKADMETTYSTLGKSGKRARLKHFAPAPHRNLPVRRKTCEHKAL
jgi:hypothetical protein